MRPTLKNIMMYLQGDEEKARLIHGICRGRIEPDTIPETEDWIRQCYNRPSDEELRMHAIDVLLENHGVEAVFSDRSCTHPEFTYSNCGETYHPTIVCLSHYDIYRPEGPRWMHNFHVRSWGDVVEALERKGVKFP